jgi:uncharacterized protein YidB (DUF937 family)
MRVGAPGPKAARNKGYEVRTMGILDQVMERLPQENASGGASGLPGAVMALLTNRQTGGLGGLVNRFGDAGLGHVAGSWIGRGANQEIAPHDLHRALGDEQVQSIAARTGMSPGQLLPLLAQFLPGIIDGLTPHGQLPAEDESAPPARWR